VLGGVWEEASLTMRDEQAGERRASGRIVRVLFDEKRRQAILVCANGEVVLLPDCPKCVKVLRAAAGEVVDGALEGEAVILRLAAGGTAAAPVGA